jgi:hypothetical protein
MATALTTLKSGSAVMILPLVKMLSGQLGDPNAAREEAAILEVLELMSAFLFATSETHHNRLFAYRTNVRSYRIRKPRILRCQKKEKDCLCFSLKPDIEAIHPA